MENQAATQHKNMAWYLSIVSLLPFVLISLTLLFLNSENAAVAPIFSVFRTYSALMLSFLGGIRWGHIIREDNESTEVKSMVFSVLPALVAWLTLLVPQEYAPVTLLILLIAFCAHGAWDSFAGNSDKLPKWYSTLRIKMTLTIAVCHIAVFFSVAN